MCWVSIYFIDIIHRIIICYFNYSTFRTFIKI
nr:MAG TPA: hypothetical protein [Bacteriophage sp.]